MGAPPLLERRLLFVTGKGGVGKTTVAAALAWLGARSGKRVLACEFDAKGDLATALAGAGPVSGSGGTRFEPDELHPGLWVMAMDPEASLREYMRQNLRLPFVTKLGALSSVFDFLANAAPGVREIVTVGKVAWEAKERHYDLIVVDATATGHIVGQLRAPQAINELVGAGLIRSQTAWILDVLDDPASTGLVVTTTAEEVPVLETIDLCRNVRAETGVDLAAVVVNRVLPDVFADPTGARKWLARVGGSGAPAAPARRRADAALGGSGVTAALLEASAIAEQLKHQQTWSIESLVDALDPAVPTFTVPQLFGVGRGLPTTRDVAEQLAVGVTRAAE